MKYFYLLLFIFQIYPLAQEFEIEDAELVPGERKKLDDVLSEDMIDEITKQWTNDSNAQISYGRVL